MSVGLPAGWTAAVSKSTGKVYYVCSATNERTFDRPVRAGEAAGERAASGSTVQVAPKAAGEGSGSGKKGAEAAGGSAGGGSWIQRGASWVKGAGSKM